MEMESTETIELQRKKIRSWEAAGLDDLIPSVVAFVLIAIVGAVGALILVNFQSNSSVAAGGTAYNIIGNGLTALTTLTGFLPLLALVIIAAAIIGVVLLDFYFGAARNTGRERY